MNRTAAILGATIVALLLAAAPAGAEDRWMPEPQPEPSGSAEPFPGEQRTDCIGEPVEVAPGEWACPDAPQADPAVATGSIGDGYDGPEPTPEPEAVEPKPEPEPVVIVEGDGDWGWSDARDLYGA